MLFAKVAEAIRAQLRPNMAEALEAFLKRAERWKPAGYDGEMALRLAYYLGDQEQDLLAQLQAHFPKSYSRMALHTRRLARKVVDARAKVFTKASRFVLTDAAGKELAATSSDAKRWAEIVEACDLLQRLKTVNRWTEALNTVVVAVGYDERAESPVLTLVAPQLLHADFDERYPHSLERAHDAAVEIASSTGLRQVSEKIEGKRFEYWSAGDDPVHLIVDGNGRIVEYPGVDGENPYRDPKTNAALLPLVAFHREPPELGFFTTANGDLVRSNRSLNITETDLHHIARCQGYGQAYIERDAMAGSSDSDKGPPPERAFGPDKVVNLRRGEKAGVLETNPKLDALEQIATADAKKAATDWDVPAGMVLADSRTVASAEALVVDREPQLEAREEQIPLYRKPLGRLFELIRIVNNAHAPVGKRLSETSRLVWHPGDLRVPFSPKDQRDIDKEDLSLDLTTRAEIYARDHSVPLEDARTAIEERQKENEAWRTATDGAARTSGPAIPDLEEPGNEPGAPMDPGVVPAGAEVVQDTALNGAQLTALAAIVQDGVNRDLPIEAVQVLVEMAFPLVPQEKVIRLIAAMKKAPPPAKPAPVPPPFPPRQPPAPSPAE
jgi:hypothetical protein